MNFSLARPGTIFGAAIAVLFALLAPAPAATAAEAEDYAAGELLVRFKGGNEKLVELPAGVPVPDAAAALAGNEGIAYAVPNYIARAAATQTGWIPDDPGLGTNAGGWQELQWGFLPCGSGCEPPGADGKPADPLPFEARGGIDLPNAWKTLRQRGRAGGAGVKVAVLDTGVAFRALKPKYAKSPDFGRKQFLPGFDFVANDKLALDEDGHGTHIAGTIGQQTGNAKGLTGVAYGAKMIPVRVLNQLGEGRARDIAKGIRYSIKQRARVINLSFEFDGSVQSCKQIKSVCLAIRDALKKKIAVFAAAGNASAGAVAFPGRFTGVTAVGAATEGACVADYSSRGIGLDLVAPGGRGEGGTSCSTADRPIFQTTLIGLDFHTFGVPADYMGTSMAAAHASGVAALILASGVIGNRPSPARIECQLKATARQSYLGDPYDPNSFGAGLLDAGRAVSVTAC